MNNPFVPSCLRANQDAPGNLRSHPKNPSICKFMIQIARFDQLGSGVLNIHKYWPIYAPGSEPVFRETRHGFELLLPLPEAASDKVTPQVTGQVAGQVTAPVGTKSGPS